MNYDRKSRNHSTISKMGADALKKYANKRMSSWRTALSELTSLVRAFTSKVFSAFASDEFSDVDKIDVSGGAGAENTKVLHAGSESLRVAKYDAPSPKKLQTLLDKLDTLNHIYEIGDVVESLRKIGDKESLKMADNFDRLRDQMIDAYEKALHSMTDIAENDIPEVIGKLQQSFQKYFDEMDKTHGGEESEGIAYYVNVGVQGDHIDFVINADLTHWPRAEHGDSLLGVMTCRLEPDAGEYKLRVFATVLDRIGLAGRYNVGKEMEGKTAGAVMQKLKATIDHELAIHEVVRTIAPLDLSDYIDETELTTLLTSIDGVTAVSFEGDYIEIEIPGSDRGVVGQAMRVITARPKISKLIKRDKYQPRMSPEGNDHWQFSLSKRK